MSKKIPHQIQGRIKHHVGQLQEHARVLQATERAHGSGQHLALEIEKRQDGIKLSFAALDEIHGHAKKHQATQEFHDLVNQLGMPDLAACGLPANQMPDWAREPQTAATGG